MCAAAASERGKRGAGGDIEHDPGIEISEGRVAGVFVRSRTLGDMTRNSAR